MNDLSCFARPGLVEIGSRGDLPFLKLNGPASSIELSPYGAHVLGWQPRGAKPVLFASERSMYACGQPIRGGVPLVFPWFGPRKDGGAGAPHGFARIREWTVLAAGATAGGGMAVEMQTGDDDASRAQWPASFQARLLVQADACLRLRLSVTNTGNSPLRFESAFHTYFAVSDVREIRVGGLEACPFLDRLAGQAMPPAGTAIQFTGETDRAYLDTDHTCTIDDRAWGRRIVVAKSGSRTTVVWNPWIAKARAMPDFGDEEWPAMVCVETANALANAVTLAPGATHVMEALISVEAL
jgi:glucose-6-phosphate 1-epimerase